MTDVSFVTQYSFNWGSSDLGMRVANCVQTSSAFAIRPPSSSSPLGCRGHGAACDDVEDPSYEGARPLEHAATREPGDAKL